MALTHYLLLQFAARPQQLPQATEAVEQLCRQAREGLQREHVAYNSEQQLCYAYLRLSLPQDLGRESAAALEAQWAELSHVLASGLAPARVSRLEQVFRIAGRSHGQLPVHHYVVETDPEAGWEQEIFNWYDQEHMPGLAGVPGCTLAQRLINHDAGPRSHACYGLLTEDTLGSPPWLAVRNTDWSSRCRPHFTNTKRLMFGLLPAAPGPA